mmetsp:Transcript_50488/g.113434  ORF Transcript_50488/g.113434 Transcript_50488/m.113434 type:complete len:295 (+) Transcript_50488:3-887(+)
MLAPEESPPAGAPPHEEQGELVPCEVSEPECVLLQQSPEEGGDLVEDSEHVRCSKDALPQAVSESRTSSTASVVEDEVRETGIRPSFGSLPSPCPCPACPQRLERRCADELPEPPEASPESVRAVERECRSRPHTRRARIRELLKRLDVAQSPCLADRLRVDARQKQAKERHIRHASGAVSSASLSPALSLRRSRSFMDLVAHESEPHFSHLSRRGPVDASVLDDVVSRLPAKPVTSCARETCTICLEVPTAGEVITTLPCCHWYHAECIREWLLHSRLCPLCKAPVVPEEFEI